jgi:hypothetical protein
LFRAIGFPRDPFEKFKSQRGTREEGGGTKGRGTRDEGGGGGGWRDEEMRMVEGLRKVPICEFGKKIIRRCPTQRIPR